MRGERRRQDTIISCVYLHCLAIGIKALDPFYDFEGIAYFAGIIPQSSWKCVILADNLSVNLSEHP